MVRTTPRQSVTAGSQTSARNAASVENPALNSRVFNVEVIAKPTGILGIVTSVRADPGTDTISHGR
ncbi:hypothetical protein GCM10007904_42250 [Oharaeibacter diazotrophicus]|nr:hypothetical protein GCM10007904_42250 [Oharaeibacter diazotrophicus]